MQNEITNEVTAKGSTSKSPYRTKVSTKKNQSFSKAVCKPLSQLQNSSAKRDRSKESYNVQAGVHPLKSKKQLEDSTRPKTLFTSSHKDVDVSTLEVPIHEARAAGPIFKDEEKPKFGAKLRNQQNITNTTADSRDMSTNIGAETTGTLNTSVCEV